MTTRVMHVSAIAGVALALLAHGVGVAQPKPAMPRVGYLSPASSSDPRVAPFRQGLADLGWVEGRTIAIEYRWAEERYERLPGLAAELIRLNVDVIVAWGPAIPAVSVDPVGTGLIASLGRPGGNVTGLSILAAGGAGKRLELLREVAPRASRVAVLWNSAHPGKDIELRETRLAADRLGVALQPVEVREPSDFDRAFAEIARGRPDALIVFSEALVLTHRRRIVEFAAKMRLPAIAETKEVAEAGGLLTYGASLPALFRRAAYYVDRILKGADPATLPVEQPTTFELVVNLRTARALGVTIPQSVLLRADQVLE